MKTNTMRASENGQCFPEGSAIASVEAMRNPAALGRVPNRRLFGPKAAARYLGICEDTLKKITDLEQIRAFKFNGRRAYRLEDLEEFIKSLPGWYDDSGEKSAKVVEKGNHDL